MTNFSKKIIEQVFFFVVLALSAYLVWLLFAPFVGALILAGIIAIVCYPLHEKILAHTPRRNRTLAAFISLVFVLFVVVTPLVILGSLILKEALSVYSLFSNNEHLSFVDTISQIEAFIQTVLPSFSFDVPNIVQQTASYVVTHFINIFTTTASTVFLLFITLIATFYFFRDGKYFTHYLVQISPLRDSYDERIMKRLARAVRSVTVGTVFVAVVQGVLTGIGLTIFSFDRAVLWGCVAAIGSFVPGVGTSIVFIPSVIYLFVTGAHIQALFLGLWGVLAVGLIDNLLGPYMMSRNNSGHPFLILLSVLGGIATFGPIGFIMGPVLLSLFLVLLEIYHGHVKGDE